MLRIRLIMHHKMQINSSQIKKWFNDQWNGKSYTFLMRIHKLIFTITASSNSRSDLRLFDAISVSPMTNIA